MLTPSYGRVGSECFEQLSSLFCIESTHFGNGFFTSIPNSLNASEFLYQPAPFDGPDSRHFQELRRHGAHCPALPIVCDRKAMRFVAKLLKHSESRRASRHPDGLRSTPDKNFLFFLGETDQGAVGELEADQSLMRS